MLKSAAVGLLASLMAGLPAYSEEEGDPEASVGFAFPAEDFYSAINNTAADHGVRLRGFHSVGCGYEGNVFRCGIGVEPRLALRVYSEQRGAPAQLITLHANDRRTEHVDYLLFPMTVVIETLEPGFGTEETAALVARLLAFQTSLEGRIIAEGENGQYILFWGKWGRPTFEAKPRSRTAGAD